MACNDHHWAFQPVNPLEFYRRLESALVPGEIDRKVEPLDVISAEMPEFSDGGFRDKYLLKEVLRKYPAFDLGIDTRAAAVASFKEDEAVNHETNDRLLTIPANPDVARVLELSRGKIRKILGRFDVREFERSWRYGPHSTLTLSRKDATVENKMSLSDPKVSARAYGLALNLISSQPALAYAMGGLDKGSVKCIDLASMLRVCEWDRYESVPKNAKTDRGIGIPPDFSVMMQLAVGRMMRSRLYHHGINLNDQSINQRAAYLGSLDGSRATVDVKSASQSVTCGLVWNQIGAQNARDLDPKWYQVLEALRSPYTLIEGELHENELFSAMGNGYTFELESLLFYSLATSCCDLLGVDTSVVSVYGDDIVLPGDPRVCDLLIEVFNHVGFRLNLDKSFGLSWSDIESGYHFRESCGKHFLNGVDVTPFYVDQPLDDPFQIVLLCNNLIRWSTQFGFRDGRVYPVLVWLLGHLGEGYRKSTIPLGEENDGIIADWDEAARNVRTVRSPHETLRGRVVGIGRLGYSVKTFAFEARSRELPDYARFLRSLYHSKECSSGFQPPQKTFDKTPFRCKPELWRVTVQEVIKVAPEIPKSAGLKVHLRPRTRIVYQWPWMGPWVCDETVESRSLLTDASLGWELRDRSKDRQTALANQRR